MDVSKQTESVCVDSICIYSQVADNMVVAIKTAGKVPIYRDDGRGKNRCLSIFMDFVEKRPNKRRSAVAASRAAGW